MKSKQNWSVIGAVFLVLIIGVILFFVQMNQDGTLVGKGASKPNFPVVLQI